METMFLNVSNTSSSKPFLFGYGYAPKYVTGKWPKQLYEEFNDWQHAQEHVRIKNNDLSTDRLHRVITSPFDGVQQQRPLWISTMRFYIFSIMRRHSIRMIKLQTPTLY